MTGDDSLLEEEQGIIIEVTHVLFSLRCFLTTPIVFHPCGKLDLRCTNVCSIFATYLQRVEKNTILEAGSNWVFIRRGLFHMSQCIPFSSGVASPQANCSASSLILICDYSLLYYFHLSVRNILRTKSPFHNSLNGFLIRSSLMEILQEIRSQHHCQ